MQGYLAPYTDGTEGAREHREGAGVAGPLTGSERSADKSKNRGTVEPVVGATDDTGTLVSGGVECQ